MRNRQFVFAPKIEYKLIAERSEANQNSLTFPVWCSILELVRTAFAACGGEEVPPRKFGKAAKPHRSKPQKSPEKNIGSNHILILGEENFLIIKSKINFAIITLMKKLLLFIIGCTVLWYLFLYIFIGGSIGLCVCPSITENTYLGSNWPTLLPEGGCGDCGLPKPPSQFFFQLFLILLPTIVILLGYGIYKGIRKRFIK